MELPSFLRVDLPTPPSNPTVSPFTPSTPRTRANIESSNRPERQSTAREVKEMLFAQFEAAFPRLMDQVYAGYTLHRAVQEYPLKLDYGQFNRWVLRDPSRKAIYEEAQEYRAEVWADRMIEHAEGTVNANGVLLELDRSRFANDTYKFLMGRQNKKRYGESKTLEVEHRISISAALEASKQRVLSAPEDTIEQLDYTTTTVEAINAEVVVDELSDDDNTLRDLVASAYEDDEDEDE